MNGPYPIYEPDDENAQNFPMPGDNPVPQPVKCPDCNGKGGQWVYDAWNDVEGRETCERCDGHGVVWP